MKALKRSAAAHLFPRLTPHVICAVFSATMSEFQWQIWWLFSVSDWRSTTFIYADRYNYLYLESVSFTQIQSYTMSASDGSKIGFYKIENKCVKWHCMLIKQMKIAANVLIKNGYFCSPCSASLRKVILWLFLFLMH